MKVAVLIFSFFVSTAEAALVSQIDSIKYSTRVPYNTPSDNGLVFSQAIAPLYQQNKLYKRRLDSLQKTIPLVCNKYVQNHIDAYISTPKQKERIGKLLGLSRYYFPIFEKALKEVGVPEEIKFITIIESALDPHASSYAGAKGLWQFMSPTARGYGLRIDNYVDERKDPVQASYAAATYLKDVYNQFGDWLLAIAAYNCGASVVLKAIEKSGGIADFWHIRPHLPKQTQRYVPAFIATNYVMSYYKKHGIAPLAIGLTGITEIIQVHNVVSLASVARAANLDVAILKVLNPSYKQHIINGSKANPKTLITPLLSKQVYAPVYEVLNTKMVSAQTKSKVEVANMPSRSIGKKKPAPLKKKLKPSRGHI